MVEAINGTLIGNGDGVSGSQNESDGTGVVSWSIGSGYVARRGVGGRRRCHNPIVGIGMDSDLALGRARGMVSIDTSPVFQVLGYVSMSF